MAFKKVSRTFRTSQYYSRKGLVSVLNKFRIKLEEILKVHAKDIHFYIGYNFKNASFTITKFRYEITVTLYCKELNDEITNHFKNIGLTEILNKIEY